MAYIEFKNVTKKYGDNNLFKDINLKIDKKDFISLTGSTGTGKTTILSLLAGFTKPDKGDIMVDKKNIKKLRSKELRNYIRNYVGFVSFDDDLIDDITVLENILLALNVSDSEIDVQTLIKKLMIEDLLNKYPYELSKTNKIKISLLRSLSKNPKLLLCDEIFLNMNIKDRNDCLEVIKYFTKKNRVPVIIASHDGKISPVSNKVITLSDKGLEKIKVNKKIKEVKDLKW